jgi:hypothetical protein
MAEPAETQVDAVPTFARFIAGSLPRQKADKSVEAFSGRLAPECSTHNASRWRVA